MIKLLFLTLIEPTQIAEEGRDALDHHPETKPNNQGWSIDQDFFHC